MNFVRRLLDNWRRAAGADLRRGAAWLSVPLLLNACGGLARAGEISTADLQLTVRARSAVSDDIRFFYLNLGVPVRDGVATVWGEVPTAEAAQQIVELIGKVKGIKRVRNELAVLPLRDWPEEWRHVQPSLRPLDLPGPSGDQPIISLLAPRPLGDAPAPPALPSLAPGQFASQEKRPDLRSSIVDIQKSDARFDGIEVVIDGGIVRLRGQGAILFTLAERVAGVLGVERVVIETPEQAGPH